MEKQRFSPFNFIFFSAIGIFMFFAPTTFMGRTSIPVDHVIGLIRRIPHLGTFYVLLLTAWGVYASFKKNQWKKSFTDAFFAASNLIGTVLCFMVFFNFGPSWFIDRNVAPYVFNIVAVPVAILIPIGSIFLAFLVNYGLMEFIGELLVPFMRPVFHTPGRAAIDAVASFVGSYSVGLIITNNVYRQGKYTGREAAIIGTGFSTVSATFMIIVARTLGLIDHWNLYFWVTLLVTFLVTAITLRIPPLSRIPSTLHPEAPKLDESTRREVLEGSRFQRAWRAGVVTGATAKGFVTVAKENVLYGVGMASSVAAAIMFFGVGALLLSAHTNIFDYTGYLFRPFFELLGFEDAVLAAKAASTSIADMFTPALLAKDAAFNTRFVIGVICISEVLFFSGMIPCLVVTDIPVRIRDIFVIWFERVVLSILIVTPIVYLLF